MYFGRYSAQKKKKSHVTIIFKGKTIQNMIGTLNEPSLAPGMLPITGFVHIDVGLRLVGFLSIRN